MTSFRAWLSLLLVSSMFGCAGPVGVGEPLEESEVESVSEPEVVPDEAYSAALPDTPEPLQIHKIPEGYFFLGAHSDSNALILGNATRPELMVYRADSGDLQRFSVPLVPRVGVDLGEGRGHAIFGHRAIVNRFGTYLDEEYLVPSSSFLIVDSDLRVLEKNLTEPIAATSGLLINETDQVLVGNSSAKSSSIVFLNVRELLEAESRISPLASFFAEQFYDRTPVAKLILDDAPYEMRQVSWRHVAVSFVNIRTIALLDLIEPEDQGFVEPRLYAPRSLISALDEDVGLFATLNIDHDYAQKSNQAAAGMEVFRVVPTRGRMFSANSQPTELPFLSLGKAHKFRSPHQRWGALDAARVYDKILLLAGSAGELFVTVGLLEEGRNFVIESSERLPLNTRRISRIDILPQSNRAYVSAPDDGLIISIDLEHLLSL